MMCVYINNAYFSIALLNHLICVCALINPMAVKQEFFAFKFQVTTIWVGKFSKVMWAMVMWNETLKRKYKTWLL